MWSIGGAVLIGIVLCAGAIVLAARRLRAELEPARRSFDLLHRELGLALQLASRDTGRAEAGRRVLLRHGNTSSPR